MAKIGEVTGVEYKTNRDGNEKKMLLQVILEDVEDPQTVEYVQRGGEQSPPVDGSRVFVLDIEPAYKIGIAFDDDTPPDETLVQGDRKFYSLLLTPGATEDDADEVAEQASIKLLKTGEIKIQAADGQQTPILLGLMKALVSGAIEINSTDADGVEKGTFKIQNTGDIEMEASSGGATANLKNDGQAEINGTGDHAIRFAAMEAKLQLIISGFNTALASKLNGAGSPGTVSVDFSTAKIDTIEVPS